jgi:hypothetical protein
MANLIGDVLDFLAKGAEEDHAVEAIVDPGGGPNLTADHFHTPGDDSPPYKGDAALMVQVPGSQNYVVIGYIDPKNPSEAGSGEKHLYARDADGAIICEIWLESDGTIRVKNGSGNITLAASGTVTINGNLEVLV